MENISLSENHRRSVSASLYLIEKMINELEQELLFPHEMALYKVVRNSKMPDVQHYESVIGEIKSNIRELSDKYKLNTTEIHISQIINSKKSVMWEILCDTTSKRLKGYGEFPKENAEEFDNLEVLQELIRKI
jgi:hypothetical protein